MQVGNEVVLAVQKAIPNAEITLNKKSSGKFHFNLWEANRQILLKAGIPEKNIEIFVECSFQDNKKYFSVRKEDINTGRMVSGIMMLK